MPTILFLHRLPDVFIVDIAAVWHAAQKTLLHTDVCLYGSLTDWIGSLTENCRGRAVKHHTAPHWSTGLQIEAHEQIQRWIHG